MLVTCQLYGVPAAARRAAGNPGRLGLPCPGDAWVAWVPQ
jgi:hypothetical protein